MPLPWMHLRPASMTSHFELSIMIGTRAISGSLAMRCRKRTIAALLSSMASSMLMSMTCASNGRNQGRRGRLPQDALLRSPMPVIQFPATALRLGHPVPFALRDKSGHLLIPRGTVLESEAQRLQLIERGLYIDEVDSGQ